MHFTLDKLLNSDSDVQSYYRLARQEWTDLFIAKRDEPVSVWAQWLTDKQIPFFEHQCGGRNLGQEIMAWSGFGTLYDVRAGFDDNSWLAKKLSDAFQRSFCSIEVKGYASRAASSYYINEE